MMTFSPTSWACASDATLKHRREMIRITARFGTICRSPYYFTVSDIFRSCYTILQKQVETGFRLRSTKY